MTNMQDRKIVQESWASEIDDMAAIQACTILNDAKGTLKIF